LRSKPACESALISLCLISIGSPYTVPYSDLTMTPQIDNCCSLSPLSFIPYLILSQSPQQLPPFRVQFLAIFGVEYIGLCELLAPRERLARVDQHAPYSQIPRRSARRRDARIEIRRPGVAHHVHGRGRIDARAHRPQHFVLVGRIDVIIDGHVISLHVAV